MSKIKNWIMGKYGEDFFIGDLEKKEEAMSELPENEANIVKNGSKAYGYNYSSLADIAKAGIGIPKMRIKPVDGTEYIEYLDDSGEWQLGARIVVPDMRGMNAAQAYGSALTYARRYTVQLAKSIACDDDSKLEAQAPAQNKNPRPKENRTLDIVKFKAEVEKLSSDDDIRRYYSVIKSSYGLTEAQQLVFQRVCAEVIAKRQNKVANPIGDHNNSES